MSADLRIDLFGTMRVVVDGEPLPKVRSRKAKWLLALLVLKNGKPVARSVVAGMLWPDTEATGALTNLRSVVKDLRQALGEQADRLLMPDRKTLAFDLRNAEVDVLAFDDAIRSGENLRASRLYPGPLLQECDEEWVLQDRAARERACLKALRELAQDADPAEAVALFQRAADIAPWQESVRRDLMTAHARAGDVNAALAVYREFAQALRGETGGAPDLQTTELYVRLRSGEFTENPPATQSAGTVPHAIGTFIGREDERVELARELQLHRLVTLTGMGGIGKTRLAREVAHSVPRELSDGAWFVALESVQDERGLLDAVITTLRIKGRPEALPLENIVESLRAKRMWLVLDNCEHIVGACTRLCERLLAEAPGLRILATSRESLGLVGEKVWPVPGLTTPDPAHLPEQPATLLRVVSGYESVRLFVERAQAASASFELTRDNARAVANLCAILEGSPLALELAACRTRTMSVTEMVARLSDHRLDLLAGNRHTGIPRHHTLRAALDWSYSLLGPEERRLFARLSVFSGGWTLEAAMKVAMTAVSVLESLVEKSLVTFNSEGRYGFLETVREYAAERLAASGERSRIEAAHLDYYVDLAERWVTSEAPNDAFERERSNFRSALDREDGDPDAGLRLVSALSRYWRTTFAIVEGTRRLENALRRSCPEPSRTRARAHRLLALFRSEVDRTAGTTLFQENLQMWRDLNDPREVSRSLHSLGLAAFFKGDNHEAKDLFDESIASAIAMGDERATAYPKGASALVCMRIGDYPKAKGLAEESLRLFREIGRGNDVASALRTLGSLVHHLGDYNAFRQCNEEAMALYRSAGHEDGVAWCLDDLGQAAMDLEQFALGQDLLEQSLTLMRKLENPLGIASVLESMGNGAVFQGNVPQGRIYLTQSLEIFRESDHRLGVARTFDGLGDALRVEGNPEADTYYRKSLILWREMGDKKRIRDGLLRRGDGLASLDASIRLWACAHRLGEEMGVPIPLPMHARHRQALRQAQTFPGFEQNWATGLTMPLELALDLALQP